MKYNFDKIVDRTGTGCLKHDFNEKIFGKKDVISMWVADMDFESPDFIVNSLMNRVKHPVYGYTIRPDSLYESIINWIGKKHNWNIKKEWITFCTGVVPSLHYCVKALTKPGDRVIVQPPVYYPFFSVIKENDRIIQNNPLKLIDGRYTINFDDLEKNTDEKTRMMFLCSPHNPGGRVWLKNELERLVKFCIERNIIIISDEIHADMVYKPFRHIPAASLSEEISQHIVTLMAPTKTFNLAGLAVSYIISENKDLLYKLNTYLDRTHINSINIFGMNAMETAYTKGELWLDELMQYLYNNFVFLEEYLTNELPEINIMKPEATYLAWMDFSLLDLNGMKLKDFIIEKAGLGLNNGPVFGIGGEGFQRLNFACPRSILKKGLENLTKAVKKNR